MIALMGEEDEMKRRHRAPEQIVRKLWEANESAVALVDSVTCPSLDTDDSGYEALINCFSYVNSNSIGVR